MANTKKTVTKKASTTRPVLKKATLKKVAAKKSAAKKVAVKKSVARKTSDKFAFPLSFEQEITQTNRSANRPEPMTGKVIPTSFVNQLESARFGKIQGARTKSTSRKGRFGLISAFVATAVIAGGLTYFITKPAPVQFSEQTSDQAKISGGVVLTEAELKIAVKKLNAPVFWAGPLKDAKYTLNASDPKQIYVRYLPGGQGVGDTKRQYRVIATYVVPGAFASTAAAGNQTNGVTLSRADGAVVYYNKLEPTNIYLASKDSDYQVEVFDEDSNTALQLATTLKTIIPIL
jgi:hypothetical protein